ncbi:MAG: hypothetical protein Q7J85_02960 [Bacillota bacterium]|nr:hypothetical protein [Bacillota bacterium]
MELLIVFIVVMVISSILRSFQRASVPPEQQPEILPDLASPEKSFYEEEIPPLAYEDGFRQPVSSGYQERKRPVSTPVNPVKKKIVSHQKKSGFNSPLADLLVSDRIILGIAVAEVLSAPRARRPFKAGGVKRS